MVWTTPLGTVNGQMPVGCLEGGGGKDVEALNWLLMV